MTLIGEESSPEVLEIAIGLSVMTDYFSDEISGLPETMSVEKFSIAQSVCELILPPYISAEPLFIKSAALALE